MKPWEKYQSESGPWEKYGQKSTAQSTVPRPFDAAKQQLSNVLSTTGKAVIGQPEAVSDVATSANQAVQPFYRPVPQVRAAKEKVMGMIPGDNLASQTARGVIDLAVPETPVDIAFILYGTGAMEKGFDALGKGIKMAKGAVSSTTKGIGKAIPQTVKQLPTTVSRAKQMKLWEKTKGDMFKSYGKQIEQYGNALDDAVRTNPQTRVNLKPIMESLKVEESAGILDPKIKTALNSSPKLKYVWENYGNPEISSKLTAKQSQEILNELNSKFPVSKLAGTSQYRTSDLALKNLKNEIRAAQIEAYPDLIPTKQEYAKFMQSYRGMKNDVLSKHFYENLDRNFSNPIVRTYIDNVLPKEAVKELGGYRIAAKAVKWAKYAMGAAALGGAGVMGADIFK